jgi:hypothetical protein
MRDARILVVLKIFSNRLFSGVQRTHRIVVPHHIGELYLFADAEEPAAPHVGERRMNIGTDGLSFRSYRRVSGRRNRPHGYARRPA